MDKTDIKFMEEHIELKNKQRLLYEQIDEQEKKMESARFNHKKKEDIIHAANIRKALSADISRN